MILHDSILTNLAIQYTLAGICIAGACVWIIVKFMKIRKNPGKDTGCIGCGLAESCKKQNKVNENNCNQKN